MLPHCPLRGFVGCPLLSRPLCGLPGGLLFCLLPSLLSGSLRCLLRCLRLHCGPLGSQLLGGLLRG
jgi:hypothetical protein